MISMLRCWDAHRENRTEIMTVSDVGVQWCGCGDWGGGLVWAAQWGVEGEGGLRLAHTYKPHAHTHTVRARRPRGWVDRPRHGLARFCP